MYNTYMFHDEWLNKGSTMNDWIYVPRRMNEYMSHDEFEQPSNCKKNICSKKNWFIHSWLDATKELHGIMCIMPL